MSKSIKLLGSPVVKLTLEERLAGHPELQAKLESLLSVVENASGDIELADEAERQVIEKIQAIGQAALQGWAESTHTRAQSAFTAQHPQAHRSRQKNSTGTVDSVE
ncbi:MAG: hypothetical protein AAFU53_05320 [Cyanobacteria bacterium J06632_3]